MIFCTQAEIIDENAQEEFALAPSRDFALGSPMPRLKIKLTLVDTEKAIKRTYEMTAVPTSADPMRELGVMTVGAWSDEDAVRLREIRDEINRLLGDDS